MPSILIVEDDITFSLMLTTWLGKKGFKVNSVSSVADAEQWLGREDCNLILSDLRLPDQDGINLLKWMKDNEREIPFIMMTGYAEIQTAVQAMKLGASDYISKPVNPENLLQKINELVKQQQTSESPSQNTRKNVAQPAKVKPEPPKKQKAETVNPYIEGQSIEARQLYEHVRLVAPTDMSVLINGSSGTGKEYVARRIHEQSNRRNAPFVAVDCGAIPKDLAASEFFGHVKGSFTGAISDKTGAFVAAQGGTLFLDEIGNLTYEVQVQLLRALQERKVRPVGSNKEIDINVRLVSATNENLRQAIDKGDFREDLYHRINEFTIRIPNLCERKEDLPLFANHFLDMANSELQKDIVGFDAETMRIFESYSWPGNLRQMKNVIRYATLLATGRYITRRELPEELVESPRREIPGISQLKDENHERELIRKALVACGNNKTKAAQMLGIDRKTLYNKLKSLDLTDL